MHLGSARRKEIKSGIFLLLGDLQALPKALDLEFLASGTQVDILDVIRGRLEVRLGVVALGDEDVVLLAVVDRLIERDRRTLFVFSLVLFSLATRWMIASRSTYHKLLFDLA